MDGTWAINRAPTPSPQKPHHHDLIRHVFDDGKIVRKKDS